MGQAPPQGQTDRQKQKVGAAPRLRSFAEKDTLLRGSLAHQSEGDITGIPRRLPLIKTILSEVLRRKDGVVQRDGRAGTLRIEFIERSRPRIWQGNCFYGY